MLLNRQDEMHVQYVSGILYHTFVAGVVLKFEHFKDNIARE